jgi:hypothetical protein
MSLYATVEADITKGKSTQWEDLPFLLRAAEAEASHTLALAALGEQPAGPPYEGIERLADMIDPDFRRIHREILPEESRVTLVVPDEDFNQFLSALQEAAFRLGMAIGARIGGAR